MIKLNDIIISKDLDIHELKTFLNSQVVTLHKLEDKYSQAIADKAAC